VRKIKFEEKPNYKLYKKNFEKAFTDEGYVEDGQFDWVLHKEAEVKKIKDKKE
jgi:hypothetical protein